MLRIVILLFFSFSLSQAKSLEVKYYVEFGIFGEVAKVHAKLIQDGNTYIIESNVTAVGSIAKAATKNLKERHVSQGHIKHGLLITDTYQMIKSYGDYTSTTIYRVDHIEKSVTRHYRRWIKGKREIDLKMRLGYYGNDDLMNFFLNIPKHITQKYQSKNYRFKVVGADRKNGRVDITIPSKSNLKEMKSLLGKGKKGDWYSTVVMHRKLYHSKKGELVVRIGNDGIVDKAVLKDLIFFGDVRIIRQ